MFKKTLLAVATTAVLSATVFNASAEDQGHGIVTFSGTVITAPCSVTPESSQIDVDLGQVADSVLNGGQYSQPADFSIKLRDCILSTTDDKGVKTTTDKVSVTFTSANVDSSDASLMVNTKESNYGGATGVGVRIMDAGYNTVTLGSAVPVVFTDTNPTQNLDFHARMESKGKNATEGDVYAQANYVLAYK